MKKRALAAATVGLLGVVAFNAPAQAQVAGPAPEGEVAAVAPPIIWRGNSLAIVEGIDGKGVAMVGVPGEDLMSGAGNTTLAQNAGLFHAVVDPIDLDANPATGGSTAFQVGLADTPGSAAFVPGMDDQPGAVFGTSIADGDFDCDGYLDVVVGAPGFTTDAGTPQALPNAGGAFVVMGAENPEDARAQYLVPGLTLPMAAATGDWFGSTLAVGNFNGDSQQVGEVTYQCDDLVVGVPGRTVSGADNAGAVVVISGGASDALTTQRVLHAGTAESNLAGVAEANDWLGAALAVGDFNGDGVDDLAVGAPNEDLRSVRDVGAVVVVPGAQGNGLVTAKSRERSSGPVSGALGGLAGAREASDLLGGALAAGDFNNDGVDDLAVGVRGEDWSGVQDVGAVVVAKGGGTTPTNPVGLLTTGGKELASGGALPGAAERYDYLGTSIAAGDMTCDGKDDLLIGVPGEDVSGAPNAGAVVTAMGDATLVADDSGTEHWQGATGGLADTAENGDRLGTSVALGDYNDDNCDDALIGVSREDVGVVVDAGAAIAVAGGISTGLLPDSHMGINSRLLVQGGVLAGNPAEAGDLVGGLHPAANAQ